MTERNFRPSIPRRLDSLQIEDDKEKGFPGCVRRRRCGALKTLLAAQRNVEACIALCEQTQFDTKDCKTITDIYRGRIRPDDALQSAWADLRRRPIPNTAVSVIVHRPIRIGSKPYRAGTRGKGDAT